MGDSLEGFSLPDRSLFASEGVDTIAQMREGYAPQPNLNDQMSPKQMRATNASPEAIAHVVGQILKAESVSNSQISSWVEAGGNAFPTFPIR
jgi:hypothetical protein